MFGRAFSWLSALLVPAVAIQAVLASGGLAGAHADTAASNGVLAAANGPVEVRAMDGPAGGARRLDVGDRVFPGDEIVTLPGVKAQVMMRDGTTFAIGEQAILVIDEYEYDPRSGRGALGAVIRRGSFRFVSGRIAKTSPGNVKLVAGSTAISVNGTEVLGTINGVADQVILMSGEVDLTSMGGDCGGADRATCSRSPVRRSAEQRRDIRQRHLPAAARLSVPASGSVGSAGQMSSPGRAATMSTM